MKKISKIILSISLILIASGLIIAGSIYYWRKSKNQTPSTPDPVDLPPSDEEEFNPSYSDYIPPNLPASASETEFKKETLKTIQERDKNISLKELEKGLLKWASEIKLADKKEMEKEKATFKEEMETWEKISLQYHSDFFNSLPSSQSRFNQVFINKSKDDFILFYSFYMKLNSQNQIDWKASFKKVRDLAIWGEKITPHRAQREYSTITDYLKKELNYSLLQSGKQFEKVTNLSELNQWAKTELVKRDNVEKYLFPTRYEYEKKLPKEACIPLKVRRGKTHNKELNLDYIVTVYEIKN